MFSRFTSQKRWLEKKFLVGPWLVSRNFNCILVSRSLNCRYVSMKKKKNFFIFGDDVVRKQWLRKKLRELSSIFRVLSVHIGGGVLSLASMQVSHATVKDCSLFCRHYRCFISVPSSSLFLSLPLFLSLFASCLLPFNLVRIFLILLKIYRMFKFKHNTKLFSYYLFLFPLVLWA